MRANQRNGATGAIVKWEEEFAKAAAEQAAMQQASGGGQFFSTQGGNLSWDGETMPDNQMPVIILDSILENAYYDGPYNPDDPQPPACFAFGRKAEEMEPHSVCTEAGTAQEGPCAECPMNEFGSAEQGRGKACKNTQRLAMLPAGMYRNGKFQAEDDEERILAAPIGFLKLPVTSVRGFAGYVRRLAEVIHRPTWGVVTKVKVVPDSKTQYKVTFEAEENLDTSIAAAVRKRVEEVRTQIEFPYAAKEAKAKPARNAGRKQRRY